MYILLWPSPFSFFVSLVLDHVAVLFFSLCCAPFPFVRLLVPLVAPPPVCLFFWCLWMMLAFLVFPSCCVTGHCIGTSSACCFPSPLLRCFFLGLVILLLLLSSVVVLVCSLRLLVSFFSSLPAVLCAYICFGGCASCGVVVLCVRCPCLLSLLFCLIVDRCFRYHASLHLVSPVLLHLVR